VGVVRLTCSFLSWFDLFLAFDYRSW